MSVKHWFVSDIHLKNVNERNGNRLLRFFHFLRKDPKNNQIFLLGDIFDFWLSDGRAFQKHYKVLIEEMKNFLAEGGKIFYFEGNHDFHIDVFWTKKMGIPVFEDIQYFKIGEYKVRLEHGDFINPQDKAYLKYRERVRQPWVELLAHTLPGTFWKNLGEFLSSRSRKKTSRYLSENIEKSVQLIRQYAKEEHRKNEFDIIITGHMHVVDDYIFKTQSGSARSINLGTWLDQPRTLLISGRHVEMINIDQLLAKELS